MAKTNLKHSSESRAYVITGPTSGIGLATAFELANYGTVILVGRNFQKLSEVQSSIQQKGQQALSAVCDLSDMVSVRRAAREIIALDLPIAGLLNNAGISPMKTAKSAQGWDLVFATNHLGPFALTDALIPHLPDGANVVFVASAVEDPDRKPVKFLGMKGARFLSVEASAKGEWKQPLSKALGADAYATSKQCVLATAMALARETPRLHVNAVEPGITPGTGLGGDAPAVLHFLFGRILTLFPPFAQYRSTPQSAFKRDFYTLFHETPSRWLLRKRLEDAYNLLDKRRKKPSDIYLDLGFETLSHFSVSFKKQFGLNPTDLLEPRNKLPAKVAGT